MKSNFQEQKIRTRYIRDNDPRSKKNQIKTKSERNAPTPFLVDCLTFKAYAWVHARLLYCLKS